MIDQTAQNGLKIHTRDRNLFVAKWVVVRVGTCAVKLYDNN